MIWSIGLIVPRTLETAVTATSFVRGESSFSNSSRSSW